jgi:2-polyprenyl-6-methoxyphenol hydroxylase-like FAD-dependent oxidoreductase
VNVGVVGLGTAGAASALFLSRAGHRVTLFERVPDPGPVGAGIMMQPSGLAVLERLGCKEPIVARGSHVDALVSQTTTGRTVLDLHYRELGEDLFGVGLHRGVLFETLYEAVSASAIDLRLGTEVVSLARRASRTHLVDSHGKAHGPFDLVVLCDGARSHVRDSLASHTMSIRPYPWGALWFIGESDTTSRELVQFVEGTKLMVGVLPTGVGPHRNGVGVGRTLASLFYSVEATRHEAVLTDLDAWKREVRRVAPPAEELLDQIHDARDLTFASYFDVSMPRWHARDVVILGDAAHATSPQLGQGCNLALCDAAALADALAASETDVPMALEAYTRARREHLAFYQLATRALTPFFQSDHTTLALLRDYLMPLATRVPFVRREMLRAMAGTKTGWVWQEAVRATSG